MRSRRTPPFLLSFFDTLCNATAALLILAVVQLKPYRDTGTAEGFHYVKVRMPEVSQEYELKMYLLDGASGRRRHSDQSGWGRHLYFDHRLGEVTLITTRHLTEKERLFVYLGNPPVSGEPIELQIDLHLPGIDRTELLSVSRETMFVAEIPEEVLR